VTYTITVKNNGPEAAGGVVLTDLLTGAVSFGTISASQGSCSGTDHLTCNLGDLANGASAMVTIPVTTTASGGISNIAKVHAQASDPDPSNNLDFAFVNVSGGGGSSSSADLSITKTVTPSSPSIGETVTATLTITNLGPDSATGVVVNDVLFGGFSNLSASSTQGNCNVSGPVICDLGSLANGASVLVTVTYTAADVGSLDDLATVISQATDSDLKNNNASVNLTVRNGSVGGGSCNLGLGEGSRLSMLTILLSLLSIAGLKRFHRGARRKEGLWI
jgi:uncharacterized repeat protein (TIGR01451 family)